MVTHALLELYTITIRNGHVVHVHTKHQAAYVLGISNTSCHTSPDSNLFLDFFIFPVSTNNLTGDTHTGADMTELNVAMSTLVEVHEVHVNLAPGNLCIILCVEVEEGLL